MKEEQQFQEEVGYFNRRLSEILGAEMHEGRTNKILHEVLNYLREVGGKRLRPVLCLLSAEAVGVRGAGGAGSREKREKALTTAVAIELLHNASLVHDDIIDENSVRRKNPSSPAKYGEKRAIVIGDFLLGLSCEMLARCGVPAVVGLVGSAISDVARGQYLEFSLRLKNPEEVTEQTYLEVAGLKTASTFVASTTAGAILGGGSEAEVESLRDYGRNLGVAFQIQDDLLDLCGDPAKTGKPSGLDIKNRERTLLLVHALNHSKPSEKAYLREIFSSGSNFLSDSEAELEIERVREIFLNTGSVDYAIRLSHDFLTAARKSVAGLADSEAKEKLELVAGLAARSSLK